MKRTFESIISLLLIVALLLTPRISTTISAEESGGDDVVNIQENITPYDDLAWKNRVTKLENMKTGKYASISGTMSGSQLEQEQENNSFNQKWFFEEEKSGTYEGYYRIRNLETGLYMTVENNSSGDADVILSELVEGSTGQYWRTDLTSNNHYKIIPACGEASGKVLALDSFLFITLDSLVVKSYSNDSNLNDEWEIWQTSTVFFVRIIYDQYVGKPQSTIQSTFDSVAEHFEKHFGVIFVLDYIGVNNDLNTYGNADETKNCPTESFSDHCDETLCGENSECATVHHRGVGRLINIDGDYVSSTITCRIVGYGLCLYISPNDDENDDENQSGADRDESSDDSDESHPGIAGFAYIQSNNNIFSLKGGRISNLMRHEIAHNLGSYDHTLPEDSSEQCMMSGQSGAPLCNSCRTTVLKYLYR